MHARVGPPQGVHPLAQRPSKQSGCTHHRPQGQPKHVASHVTGASCCVDLRPAPSTIRPRTHRVVRHGSACIFYPHPPSTKVMTAGLGRPPTNQTRGRAPPVHPRCFAATGVLQPPPVWVSWPTRTSGKRCWQNPTSNFMNPHAKPITVSSSCGSCVFGTVHFDSIEELTDSKKCNKKAGKIPTYQEERHAEPFKSLIESSTQY
ncbi:hypothetical protein AG1IA_09279 [Rhizoctonia solani AG-1 IA]|uniref:Uncharacterized protein n=1 Tax=Thanatephorus cucumeris (strain AG1-IA) TaxID=983506 RepID=L8WK11_THACA|nr:hypothetical protein AG1IA_09279 [Rhizoctonia solani AG-1 IA]